MRPRKTRKRKLTKSQQMARVRSRDTAPELALRRALWHQGLRYRLTLKLPGTPDLCFVSQRVAIFVDGCFWHRCPQHFCPPVHNAEFWAQKVTKNVERDRRVDAALSAAGWTVVRIWEHQVKSDLAEVVVRVKSLLERREEARRV
ncbi:very short patch repair endonuclease [Burkholderia pseudomallei]|nr:very short patch repair endonuclease [Burkholderia pseudomallei]